MDRKAFALALIGAATALAACADNSDSHGSASPSEEMDLSTASIGNGGGCVTSAQGRSGELRGKYAHIKLTKDQFGAHAQVAIFDAKTGLLVNQPGEYSYEKVAGGEIEVFYINSGDRFAKFRIRSAGSGAEIVDLHDTAGAPVPATCNLQAGGPGLTLPVAQKPAESKSIGADFPLPPRNMATCTSTALVNGKVMQLHFEHAELYDDFLTAYANVYDATTHLFTENLLEGSNASFKDRATSFALVGAPESPNVNKEFGTIEAKGTGADRHLTFKSDYGGLKALGEIPLSCDFED